MSPELDLPRLREALATDVPLVVPGTGLPGLIPGIERLLATPYLQPQMVRLQRDGRDVPLPEYCRVDRFTDRSPVEHLVRGEAVLAALGTSCAVKFDRLELWSAEVRELADLIGDACAKRVKTYGFVSPRGERMVPAHRDPAHVIVCQVEGEKDWELGGPPPGAGTSWSAADPVELDVVTRIRLSPGDVLALPYGHAHRAASASAVSYHLSFALEGTTVGELRHRVVEYLLRDLDGTDSGELDPARLATVCAELAGSLHDVARRVAHLPDRDADAIFGGCDTALLARYLDDDR